MHFNKTNRRARLSPSVASNLTHEGGVSHNLGVSADEDIKRLDLYLNTAALMLAGDTFYTTASEDIRRIVANIIEVMQLDRKHNDKFVLQLAAYLRQKKLLRRTPQLVVVSAILSGSYDATTLAEYTSKVITRPDDAAELIAILNYFNEQEDLPHGSLPIAARDGIARALSKFNEYQLMKYELANKQVRLIDVMRLCRNQLLGSNKTINAVFGYLDGKRSERVKYIDALPMTSARKKLFALKGTEFSAERCTQLVKQANVTWEQLVSQFGSTREVWEVLISLKLVPGMAFLRNIRNMLQAQVPVDKIVEAAAGISVDKVYPHQIVGAYSYLLNQPEDNYKLADVKIVLDAIFSKVVDSTDTQGITIVMPDFSASMNSTVGGGKSELTCKDVSIALGLLCAQTSGIMVPWASRAEVVPIRKGHFMGQVETLNRVDVDHGTELHTAFKHLTDRKIYADRLIVISDMQVWPSGQSRYGKAEGTTFLDKYKKEVNPNVWVHSIDVRSNGTGQQFDPKNPKVSLMGGFTNDLLGMSIKAEQGVKEGKTAVESVLDEIRKM